MVIRRKTARIARTDGARLVVRDLTPESEAESLCGHLSAVQSKSALPPVHAPRLHLLEKGRRIYRFLLVGYRP